MNLPPGPTRKLNVLPVPLKADLHEPVLQVTEGKGDGMKKWLGWRVDILGPSRLVRRRASAWLETEAEIEIDVEGALPSK